MSTVRNRVMSISNVSVFALLLSCCSASPLAIDSSKLVRRQSACAASTPICYQYDSQFPPASSWLDWSCLVSLNSAAMEVNDGPTEVANVIAAVQNVANFVGIDP